MRTRNTLGLKGNWLQLFAEPPAPPAPPTPPAPPSPPAPPTPPTPPTPPAETEQERIDKAAAAARRAAESEAQKGRDKWAQERGYKDWADFEAKDKAAREKDLTEAQREKKRADEAEAAKTSERQRSDRIASNAELKVLAATMGCDPDVAVAMVDRSGIKVDDEGNVTGAKEAMEALKKAKPALFGQAPTPGAGGTVVPGGGAPTPKTPAALAADIAKERKGATTTDPWAPKQ